MSTSVALLVILLVALGLQVIAGVVSALGRARLRFSWPFALLLGVLVAALLHSLSHP